ncbi:hypothetical protein ACFLYR_01990 [Chloroflexota bacterium]
MTKRINWVCDDCKKESEYYIIPPGWLECSYHDRGRWRRYCFCSNTCLEEWSAGRRSYHADKFSYINARTLPDEPNGDAKDGYVPGRYPEHIHKDGYVPGRIYAEQRE